MDKIILNLHPVTDAAWNVLKDPRNARLLNHNDDGPSESQISALSLSLNQAPKTGTDYIIGRHADADILLTDLASSTRHCSISVSIKGIPVLHERSTNGTRINGKHCNNQSFEIQNEMQIDIRGAAFDIRVPWRGKYQPDYEYNARRAKDHRAMTPLASLPSPSAPTQPWDDTIESYVLTNTFIDSLKIASREIIRTEIVRKGRSFYAAKRFNNKGLGQQEFRAWKRIMESNIQHPNIIQLEEVLHWQTGPVIITELLPIGNFGEIFCKNGSISYDIAISVMKQLLGALGYLHKLGIVHTTIQLDNLLVSSKQPIHIKLTGFEFSTCGEAPSIRSPSMSVCPAPELWERHYRGMVAPLIWEGILANKGYSEKRPKPSWGSPIDIWSAGVICSQLTLGKAPCYYDSQKTSDEQAADYVDLLLAVRLKSSTERSEAWAEKLGLSLSSIPPLLLKFLQKLLEPESQSRAKAEACLTDSWLTQDAQELKNNAEEPHPEEPAHKRRRLTSAST